MASFVVCFNKKGNRISEDYFLPMHAALQHYAIDGSHYVIDGAIAYSSQPFWTTPEEQGEQQPLQFADRYFLVWDGRIDNRQDVYHSLKDREIELEKLSDAQLFLRFFLENGIESLKNVIGPFAWVLYDKTENVVLAARDSMGARYLVYAETDEWCCIASTVNAITAHPAFSFELNQRLVTQNFSFNYANEDSTFCQGVDLVLPGHYVVLNNNAPMRQCEYYLPEPRARIRYKDSREYDEHFRALFSTAVKSRLRSMTPIASMLSGGLDSSPMTLEAANLLNDDQKLYGVTWSFDDLKECDERGFLDELYEKHSILPVWVNCDDAYPLNSKDSWPVNPDRPFDYPYRGKHLRAYQAIKDKKCRVTLSGMAGDDLYSGTELIVYEYLRQFRLLTALKELKHRYRYSQSFNLFLRTHLFWYTKLWFQLKGLQLKGRSQQQPPQITDQAFKQVQGDKSFLGNRAQFALRPRQYEQLVGTYYSNPLATEKFFSTPYETEVRYPLRDRRLVEFMLQIPSEHLYSQGVTRPIIRRAFKDVVPKKIINRNNKTSFHYLLKKLETCELTVKDIKDSKNWSYYVNSDWIDHLTVKNTNHLMVVWQSKYWQYWMRQREN